MASRSQKASHSEPLPDTDEITGHETEIEEGSRRKRRRREANVYDAVAGRVTTTLPLDDGRGGGGGDSGEGPAHHRRTRRDRHRDPTLAPDQVLFRRAGAPVRYAEKDIYYVHERLPDGGRGVLPDGDMVKAVHSYAGHFYAALAARRRDGRRVRDVDERSMDETALLAFGILLEEAGREVLGSRGDLVFTEGVEVDGDARQGEEGRRA
ncbi:hypothetical protein F4779DRAFT_85919 [Xylariaceae sp. FL0662B]|nr:hypothetical protein F4779DRAFT_85919 [Xylariaceae sp. FL0662B]